jgi:ABC-2 type transport system ATP-binding protein
LSKTLIQFSNVGFSYGDRVALETLSFDVREGELFCVVGPNGGGKSTTFKILSTLLKPRSGSVSFWGIDGVKHPEKVRPQLGVVFQSPALDKKLTIEENLVYHGKLYGLRGASLIQKVENLLKRFSLFDRKDERVEKLSGGLKRRVEIAKSLLSDPKLLILDEPTTGLDPVARREMWSYLDTLRKEQGISIVFTTHLMDEAESADRTLVLNQGKVVTSGTPAQLKSQMGGDVISLKTTHPEALKEEIEKKFSVPVKKVDDELRIEKMEGARFIPTLVEAFPHQILSVTLGKPTLEDLFIHLTGQRFVGGEA